MVHHAVRTIAYATQVVPFTTPSIRNWLFAALEGVVKTNWIAIWSGGSPSLFTDFLGDPLLILALTLALSFGTVRLESVQALPVALWLVCDRGNLGGRGCCMVLQAKLWVAASTSLERSVKDTS